MIEVLIVMGVIVLLVALYISPSSDSRKRALITTCKRNLERTYMAMDIFANEHEGQFPQVSGARTPAEALAPLVPKYTSDSTMFICPVSSDKAAPSGAEFARGKISYAYYMGRRRGPAQPLMSDQQVDSLPKGPRQLVFSNTGKPPGNNHGKSGGNVLFTDGQVQECPALARVPFETGEGVILLNP